MKDKEIMGVAASNIAEINNIRIAANYDKAQILHTALSLDKLMSARKEAAIVYLSSKDTITEKESLNYIKYCNEQIKTILAL